MVKLNPEDQRRLIRAIRLTHQIHAHFLRENGIVPEARPKRGGRAFRKRRSFHEN
jgi:hypothetical protein